MASSRFPTFNASEYSTARTKSFTLTRDPEDGKIGLFIGPDEGYLMLALLIEDYRHRIGVLDYYSNW